MGHLTLLGKTSSNQKFLYVRVDKFCPTGYNISTGTSGQEALKTFGLYSLLIINSNNELDWVFFTVSYYSLDVILFYVIVSPPPPRPKMPLCMRASDV